MSIPEQAGKVATSAIEGLKGSPGLLVLVMLQIVTMGMLVWINDKQNTRRQEREMFLLRECFSQDDNTTRSIPTGPRLSPPPGNPKGPKP